MIFDQRDFDVRFEWGPHGVAQLAPNSDAVVIVDVLTFSTAVVVAAAKGAATWVHVSFVRFTALLRLGVPRSRRSGGSRRHISGR